MTLSNVFHLIAGKAQLLSLQAPGAAPEEWAVLLCHGCYSFHALQCLQSAILTEKAKSSNNNVSKKSRTIDIM